MKGVTAAIILCFGTILVQAISVRDAHSCKADTCSGNCRCFSKDTPLSDGEAPLLIALTFDEAVVKASYDNYWKPLLIGRTNPDGNPISGTFFVPHEYTDYQRVRDLYVNGFEIASGSITRNSSLEYWLKASQKTLVNEFLGQRTIISNFANIPIDDITGARTPMLTLNGDASIRAYIESGIVYDNSMTAHPGSNYFPYTFDYRSKQECLNTQRCPLDLHPGFWEVPIIDLTRNGQECNSLWSCGVEGTADHISSWLLGEVDARKAANKAPMILMLSTTFFAAVENSFEGFQKFLDGLGSDVFLVSVKQIIEWTKNPVAVDQFRTEVPERNADCFSNYCTLYKEYDQQIRYMMTCSQPCPDYYPWIDNILGNRTR